MDHQPYRNKSYKERLLGILSCFMIDNVTFQCSQCHTFCHNTKAPSLKFSAISSTLEKLHENFVDCDIQFLNAEIKKMCLPYRFVEGPDEYQYKIEYETDEQKNRTLFESGYMLDEKGAKNKNNWKDNRPPIARLHYKSNVETTYKDKNVYDGETFSHYENSIEQVPQYKKVPKTREESYTVSKTKKESKLVMKQRTIRRTEYITNYDTWAKCNITKEYVSYIPENYWVTEWVDVPYKETNYRTVTDTKEEFSGYKAVPKQTSIYKPTYKTVQSPIYLSTFLARLVYIVPIEDIVDINCSSCKCYLCQNGRYPLDHPVDQWTTKFENADSKTCLVCGLNHKHDTKNNNSLKNNSFQIYTTEKSEELKTLETSMKHFKNYSYGFKE
jgi:hypothetical protein